MQECGLAVVRGASLCHCIRMEIAVTKPIEDFIREQIAKGYANESEVVRQALLRWMAEDDFDAEPPRLREKLEGARQGQFRPYDPLAYNTLLASIDETVR